MEYGIWLHSPTRLQRLYSLLYTQPLFIYWIDWSSDFRRPSPSNNRRTAGLATWTDLAVVTVVLLLNATVIKMLGITISFIYPSWKQMNTSGLAWLGTLHPCNVLDSANQARHYWPTSPVYTQSHCWWWAPMTTQQRYHLPLGLIRAVHSAAQKCPQQLFPIWRSGASLPAARPNLTTFYPHTHPLADTRRYD